MKRPVGLFVLALSAGGYPLTQVVMRRWGRRGATVVEAVSMGLAIRDDSMIAGGVPSRLRPFPGTLLRLELTMAVAASAAGLFPLLVRARKGRVRSAGSRPECETAGAHGALRAAHSQVLDLPAARPGLAQGRLNDAVST